MKKILLGSVLGAFSMVSITISAPTVMAQSASDLAQQLRDLQRHVEAQDARLNDQKAQLDKANQEIANMRQNQQMHFLAERRADEVRAMITNVLEDSASRDTGVSKALQRQTAGWDENDGFFIRGYLHQNFLLRIGGYLQTRAVYSYSDNPVTANQSEFEYGFELSRARLRFSGHVINTNTRYHIELEFGRRNGVLSGTLRQAWISHTYPELGLTMTAGQFKTPFLREFITEATHQQFVEMSLIANTYGGGYTQGLMTHYDMNQFRTYVALTNGINSSNNWNRNDVEYAATARVEYLPYGKVVHDGFNNPVLPHNQMPGLPSIDPTVDFQSWLGSNIALLFGFGLHFQQGDPTSGDNDTLIIRWNADAALELNGLSLYAMVLGNHHVDGIEFDEYAFQIQAGYFVYEELEFVGRFEYIMTDRRDTEDLEILTLGVNYYFQQHRYKVSADISYAFSPISAAFADESLGWRQTSGDTGEQLLVRIQIQLMF